MRIRVWPILLAFSIGGMVACQNDSKTAEVEQTEVVKPVNSTSTKAPEPVKSEEDESNVPNAQEVANDQEQLAAVHQLEQEVEAKEKEASAKRREKRRKAREKKRAEEKLKEETAQEAEKNNTTYIPLEEAETVETPSGKLQFTRRSHDFGRIQEGDTILHNFTFYNSGVAPIVITNVKASCGCTQTTYPEEPVMPGEKGMIGVTFDSKSKLGKQKPFISVTTNGTPKVYSLYLEGLVDTDRPD